MANDWDDEDMGETADDDLDENNDAEADEDAAELEDEEIRDGEQTDDGAEDDPGESAETQPLDPLVVRLALQRAGEDGASVEELQREIEAAHSGYHPTGVIYAVALGLAKEGKAREVGAGEADARFWFVADDRAATLERRANIIRALFNEELQEGTPSLARSEMFEKGATEADVDALLVAGVIRQLARHDDDVEDEDGEESKEETQSDPLYELKADAIEQIIRLGASALAMLTLPKEEAPAEAQPTADPSGFAREALEKLEAERAERLKTQAQLDKLRAWMANKGLSADAILDPPAEPDPTTGETFEFKESRPVDDAERGRMFQERVKLDEQLALARARLDAAKATFNDEKERIDGEVEELIQASKCNSRIVIIEARRIPDWDAKVFRIVAADDGRELGTEPMPRGTQRPIPGTEAASPAAASPKESTAPPAKAAVDAFVDEMASRGVKVSASRRSDGTPTIHLDHAEERAPAHAPVLVDMSKLTKWQAQVYDALKAANEPVTTADLATAVQRVSGQPVGPSAAKFLLGAAEEFVTTGIVVKEDDAFRVLGASRVKSTGVALEKSPTELVEELLRREGMLTTTEIGRRLNLTSEQVKEALATFKKRSVLTSDDGKTKAKKYGIAGAAQPEARA